MLFYQCHHHQPGQAVNTIEKEGQSDVLCLTKYCKANTEVPNEITYCVGL